VSEEEELSGSRAPAPRRPPAGLCDTCVHQRLINNTRGSSFSMCDRSRSDPAYPRYPRLPVLECAGHEPRPADTAVPEGPR
jgi:hypothetical protein